MTKIFIVYLDGSNDTCLIKANNLKEATKRFVEYCYDYELTVPDSDSEIRKFMKKEGFYISEAKFENNICDI